MGMGTEEKKVDGLTLREWGVLLARRRGRHDEFVAMGAPEFIVKREQELIDAALAAVTELKKSLS